MMDQFEKHEQPHLSKQCVRRLRWQKAKEYLKPALIVICIAVIVSFSIKFLTTTQVEAQYFHSAVVDGRDAWTTTHYSGKTTTVQHHYRLYLKCQCGERVSDYVSWSRFNSSPIGTTATVIHTRYHNTWLNFYWSATDVRY